ncbi:SRPBCC family protein [Amycolatopsis pittospori]|uniref:SRPBCC family protein n=1 Tax=Amycolatopsis pittospori TaxID=2749434 RepID=UPI0015F085B0|nr:SRPBCC family protein [Amycolatopsis pittospori]
MVEVTRRFTVATSPDAVVDYLRDFSRAVDWDPGTMSCERIDAGPLAVGAKWHNVSKISGIRTELTYELTRLEPGRIVFVGTNDTATSTDDITITAGERPSTTELTYHATIEFSGAAKLASPIAKVVFEKVGNDTEKSLTRILGDVAD